MGERNVYQLGRKAILDKGKIVMALLSLATENSPRYIAGEFDIPIGLCGLANGNRRTEFIPVSRFIPRRGDYCDVVAVSLSVVMNLRQKP